MCEICRLQGLLQIPVIAFVVIIYSILIFLSIYTYNLVFRDQRADDQ